MDDARITGKFAQVHYFLRGFRRLFELSKTTDKQSIFWQLSRLHARGPLGACPRTGRGEGMLTAKGVGSRFRPLNDPYCQPTSWRNRLPTPFWQCPPEDMPVLGQAPSGIREDSDCPGYMSHRFLRSVMLFGGPGKRERRCDVRPLSKFPVEKPAGVGKAAEEPEALAAGGFHAIVVATDAGLPPPAGFDPLRSPASRDPIIDAIAMESSRRPGGHCRNHRQRPRGHDAEPGPAAAPCPIPPAPGPLPPEAAPGSSLFPDPLTPLSRPPTPAPPTPALSTADRRLHIPAERREAGRGARPPRAPAGCSTAPPARPSVAAHRGRDRRQTGLAADAEAAPKRSLRRPAPRRGPPAEPFPAEAEAIPINA